MAGSFPIIFPSSLNNGRDSARPSTSTAASQIDSSVKAKPTLTARASLSSSSTTLHLKDALSTEPEKATPAQATSSKSKIKSKLSKKDKLKKLLGWDQYLETREKQSPAYGISNSPGYVSLGY